MITTKIQIKPHLAEYIYGKFGNCDHEKPVTIPRTIDLYFVMWDLMCRRPKNAPRDVGNLEFSLPKRDIGKNPEQFNYLSQRAASILESHIQNMMFAEIHTRLRENKIKYNINYLDTVFSFMKEYCIESITEDAFVKEYYRLRRREYYRKKNAKKNIRQTT